ncbi:nucleotidyltransferase family protein [Lachnoclostridium sp.]|nr:nucleotidyltransferase family protein [Lachnoclostridium sp.]
MEVYNERIVTFVIYNEIASILNDLDFPCCIVKGKPLSKQAYNDFLTRKSGDVDFLMSKKNIVNFERVLIKHGFTSASNDRANRILCLSSSHQIPSYQKLKGGIHIEADINFDIFWGEYKGNRINIDEFILDAVEMDVYGSQIKTLPPLKAMVQLILHHYKEMNSIYHLSIHDCIKRDMFRDVYYLWKNNCDTLSLEKLYSVACEYEIIQYVYYVLHFTYEVFQDVELSRYADVFRTPEGVELLDYYGLSEQERKPWRFDFKTRLDTKSLYELIKDDLTQEDLEKLERNHRIFG